MPLKPTHPSIIFRCSRSGNCLSSVPLVWLLVPDGASLAPVQRNTQWFVWNVRMLPVSWEHWIHTGGAQQSLSRSPRSQPLLEPRWHEHNQRCSNPSVGCFLVSRLQLRSTWWVRGRTETSWSAAAAHDEDWRTNLQDTPQHPHSLIWSTEEGKKEGKKGWRTEWEWGGRKEGWMNEWTKERREK